MCPFGTSAGLTCAIRGRLSRARPGIDEIKAPLYDRDASIAGTRFASRPIPPQCRPPARL